MQSDRLRRREFIAVLGGAAAAGWPLAASAQQAARVRRVAAIMGGQNGDTDPEGRAWFLAFRKALKDLGWEEGHNFYIEYRWPAGDLDRIQAIAKEFVDLKPDVIFAGNTPSVVALLRETRSVPIVFTNLSDPVGTGVVGSLARPGGNVTGFAAYEYSFTGKWVEMLKEIAPAVTRVTLLFNPETAPHAQHYLSFMKTSVTQFGMEATAAPIRSINEMETAIEEQARAPGRWSRRIARHVHFRQSRPADYGDRPVPPAGHIRTPWPGDRRRLLSYGPDTADLYRRAASYVDRVLKGEKAGDLPVQNPIKYELVVNLKTAKALGLDVPPMLLARADEVIE
jgi:putative tryptophan/tyrosine transport system substrate-binding protein